MFRNRKLIDPNEIQSSVADLGSKYMEGYQTYQQLRIYYPPNIDSEVSGYARKLNEFLSPGRYPDLESLIDDLRKKERIIVTMIQEFVGAS